MHHLAPWTDWESKPYLQVYLYLYFEYYIFNVTILRYLNSVLFTTLPIGSFSPVILFSQSYSPSSDDWLMHSWVHYATRVKSIFFIFQSHLFLHQQRTTRVLYWSVLTASAHSLTPTTSTSTNSASTSTTSTQPRLNTWEHFAWELWHLCSRGPHHRRGGRTAVGLALDGTHQRQRSAAPHIGGDTFLVLVIFCYPLFHFSVL